MGKGSSAPSETTSTVTQSSLPAYAQPYYERLMGKAEEESNQPYTAYPGQRTADFSANQNAAFGGIQSLAQNGNPTLDAAGNYIQGAGQLGLSASNYAPNQITSQNFTGADAQQYMNPYLNNVLDTLQSRTQQAYTEGQGARNTAAQTAGAFGGSRQAVGDSLAARDLNSQLGAQQAQELSNAYSNAQGMFTSDQARNLQAQTANETARQGAVGLGLQGANLGLQAGQSMADLGNSQQTSLLERLNALSGVGQQQQQLQQTQMDTAYQDFTNQRDYNRQNINWLSGILHGVPTAASSDVTQYSPAPNQLSQLLGTGVGALGLSQALT